MKSMVRGVLVEYVTGARFRRDTRDINPVCLSLGAQGVPP